MLTYVCIVSVLQEGDSAMRNPSFPLRSPQSGCSPASSEGTPKRKDTRSGKEALQCIHFAYLFSIMGEAATYSETLL